MAATSLNSVRLTAPLSEAIRSSIQASSIILFGSRARGDERTDSDVDLLIVADQTSWHESTRAAEIGRLRCALPACGLPIDLLLYTPQEIVRWQGAENHVVTIALSEGRVLYER